MPKTLSKRLRFFFSHLTLSIIVGVITLSVIFFVWYPFLLAKALGVIPIVLMLFVIDVVVGPLFGLLVYKEGKKTLKMDLTVIIILQIAAFLFGFYSIAKARPAWIVYDNNVFTLIKNSDINTMNIKRAEPQFQKPSLFGYQYVQLNKKIVGINPPTSVTRQPDYYQNFDSKNIKGLPYTVLEKYNDKQIVEQVVKKYPQADSWLPLATPNTNLVVLIDNKSNSIIKIVDLRPW